MTGGGFQGGLLAGSYFSLGGGLGELPFLPIDLVVAVQIKPMVQRVPILLPVLQHVAQFGALVEQTLAAEFAQGIDRRVDQQ